MILGHVYQLDGAGVSQRVLLVDLFFPAPVPDHVHLEAMVFSGLGLGSAAFVAICKGFKENPLNLLLYARFLMKIR